jgi:hypothetical protein
MSFTTNPHSQADKVYLDLVITNLDTTTKAPPTLYYNQTRNSPIIANPEDYYLSIIRFTLDTPTLPIFLPEIQPNQPDLNLTIYSVSLSWTNPATGITYTQVEYIIFAPQDLSSAVPQPPSQTSTGLQDNSSGYYYIYTFQYWIYLINQTFATCFTNLATQVALAGAVLPTTNAPIMTFDTNTQIAILNCDVLGYNYTSSNYIKIFMNPALFQLFSSFPFIIESFDLTNNNLNVLIQTNTFGGANEIQFPPINPTYQAIQVVQEYSTIALWSPITSIVFCSNTLPIVPTNISAPAVYVNGTIFNNGNNSMVEQIITDFVSDTGFYKPNIVYNPSAQYRLISLTGNRPIYNVDISVFWKDRIGALVPVKLGSGTTATVKILFSKKGSDGTTGVSKF